MQINTFSREIAEADNRRFEQEVYRFLQIWILNKENNALLRFDQPLDDYLKNDALRDFF